MCAVFDIFFGYQELTVPNCLLHSMVIYKDTAEKRAALSACHAIWDTKSIQIVRRLELARETSSGPGQTPAVKVSALTQILVINGPCKM